MTESLAKLQSITGTNLSGDSSDWNDYFDPIGLNLEGKLENYEYWCTQKNSITFASTGGDGVHFGLLDIGNGITEESPVVMTVPMCDTPNTVVGSNLVDFLSLGCRQGFFVLEQLIYQFDVMVDELDSGLYGEEMEEAELDQLDAISSGFNLSPWTNHKAKLANLRDEFHHHIDALDEPE